MKKSVVILIFMLGFLLIGCEKDEKYVGNADSETVEMLSDVLHNYEKIKTKSMKVDKKHKETIDGEVFYRVVGEDGFEDFASYVGMLKETFTEDLVGRYETFSDYLEEIFAIHDGYIYVRKDDLDFLNVSFGRKIDYGTIDVLFKDEGIMIISYRSLDNNPFGSSYSEDTLIFKEENGKYLISDNDGDIYFKYGRIKDSNITDKIREYYNISESDNKIVFDSLTYEWKDEDLSIELFTVYSAEKSNLKLENACYITSNNGEIVELEEAIIEDGKIVNKVFSEIYPENNGVEMLIAKADEDNYSPEDVDIDYIFFPKETEDVFIEISKGEEDLKNKFIIIEKYLNDSELTINGKRDKSYFYLGVSGDLDFEIKNDNGEYSFSTDDVLLDKTLPEAVKKVDIKTILEYLGNW